MHLAAGEDRAREVLLANITMELTASYALRVFALKCFDPLDDATNLTSMAPAAPQEIVSCRFHPIVDLAPRESI